MALALTPTIPTVLPLTSRDIGLADIGNYYVATTGVPGTGIIGFATTTTFAIGEANPYLYLYNSGQSTIYPAYLRLQLTVVPTASTNMRFTHTVDGPGNKVTAAAPTSTALVPQNVHPLFANTSKALISVGANVVNAPNAGTRRILGSQLYRNSIGIVNDTYQFNFGQASLEPVNLSATYSNINYAFAQPVIPPNYNWSVVFWAPSTSAGPTFEVEIGYFEK
jgi:hypothetical protein